MNNLLVATDTKGKVKFYVPETEETTDESSVESKVEESSASYPSSSKENLIESEGKQSIASFGENVYIELVVAGIILIIIAVLFALGRRRRK
ncbi:MULTISPECIES: hypothetical protein [Enterococcus]|uniref:Gram-positive cocci surface proteins LPxTG domain-containing protein n=1 Tax=Enterococcus thailandicus TaxID=417368 RepID=A0A179EUC0_ENTTH|nr:MULTISPECIES: hypothetical protein [Enterococcus]MDT2847332.1 hypothetical protein [Enterococcus thailandicus]OAQ56752.1 hypothetical protein A6E74_11500 [Enterococcus thailandicus]OTP22690.1 hypothetical protein A5800_000502 [Enterococcus sp. 5B7_DIV0075]GMC02451.1 hypothetical protein K2F_27120 [Enterococcus thailandicus]